MLTLAESTEEQLMLAAVARNFVEDIVQPRLQEQRERFRDAGAFDAVPDDFVKGSDLIGLRGLGVPEDLGGTPVDALTQVMCVEELGRGDAGYAMLLAHSWLLSALVAAGGRPTIRETWLQIYLSSPGMFLAASPEQLGRAISDPAVRSSLAERDPNVPGLQVTTGADGWVVTGKQPGIAGAAVAHAFVVVADVAGSDRSVLLLVPRDAEGVVVEQPQRQTGHDLHARTVVTFNSVDVPEDNTLDADPDLVGSLRSYCLGALLLESAGAVGISQALLDAGLRHASERVQGGEIILRHQAIARLLSEVGTNLETMRAVTYRAARAVDTQRLDASRMVLAARLHTGEAVCSVSRLVMELFGGSGVMREVGLEAMYRDAITFRNGSDRDDQRFALTRALTPNAPNHYGGNESLLGLLGGAR